MRISFDLDDTLICYGGCTPSERRLSLIARWLVGDEPLRLGTRELATKLRRRGHEFWVYTTSGRSRWRVRWWLQLHGIRAGGVINAKRHAECFGAGSEPSKRPHVFGIHLHVDNSPGVKLEGERHGFHVCVVRPDASDWVQHVLAAIDQLNAA